MRTKIYQCQIITNGCIYDQRIYDLLDSYFGNNYSIAISVDRFHNESIVEVYGNNKKESANSFLQPQTLEDITKNLVKHSKNSHFRYTKDISNNLINNGRAKNLTDVDKKEYSILGYFYDVYNDHMLVGPALFIDAYGYIGDVDSEIKHRQEENLGQVGKDSIANSIIDGGIKEYFATLEDYYAFCKKRVEEHYHTNTCKCYIFQNKKIVETERIKDTSFGIKH